MFFSRRVRTVAAETPLASSDDPHIVDQPTKRRKHDDNIFFFKKPYKNTRHNGRTQHAIIVVVLLYCRNPIERDRRLSAEFLYAYYTYQPDSTPKWLGRTMCEKKPILKTTYELVRAFRRRNNGNFELCDIIIII